MNQNMWQPQVQQPRQVMPNVNKFNNQAEPNSWEDLLDSGYLDRQLNQMNFNGGQQQPRPSRPPVPLMSVVAVPPPHLLVQPYNNCNQGLLGRHPPPPLMSQPVSNPRPRYQRPQFQPHPNSFVRQPQMMNGPPMIDTSVPPPRLPHFQPRPVLLQRQAPPQSNSIKGPLTDTDLSAPFSNAPTVKVVGEDEHRTQYIAPGPKVKILKRPSSTPSNLSSQGGNNGDGPDNKTDLNGANNGNGGGLTKSSSATKSLKQREEEYAQARLRILGSTGTESSTETESK